MVSAFLLTTLTLVTPVSADSKADLQPGPFPVGFKVVRAFDYSRSFGSPAIDRPMLVTIWYPAAEPQGTPLRLAEYLELELMEELGAPPTAEDTAKNLRRWKDEIDAVSGGQVDSAIFAVEMAAYRDARAADGSFPLLVYGPGADGTGFENSVLFEYVASHGYIVASSPSMGTFRHAMDALDVRGLATQSRDMEFVLATMQGWPQVEWSRTAVAGWSWGGLAAMVTQMRDRRIDAVVSLDGSIALHERIARELPDFELERMRVPYLFLVNNKSEPSVHDFAARAKYARSWIANLGDLGHSEFASFPYLVRKRMAELTAADRAGRQAYVQLCSLVLSFLDDTIGGKPRDLAGLMKAATTDGTVSSWLQTSPAPPPLLEEDFLALASRGEVARARAAFEEAREADPVYSMFREYELVEVAFDLLDAGDTDSAVSLLQIAVDADPQSFRAHGWLARMMERNADLFGALQHFAEAYALALAASTEDPRAMANLGWYERSIARARSKLEPGNE